MAELLCAGGSGERSDRDRYQSRHEAHGSEMRPVRRAPGPRLRRRTESDGTSILHELGGAGFQAQEIGLFLNRGKSRESALASEIVFDDWRGVIGGRMRRRPGLVDELVWQMHDLGNPATDVAA